jgi:hypothetical protein
MMRGSTPPPIPLPQGEGEKSALHSPSLLEGEGWGGRCPRISQLSLLLASLLLTLAAAPKPAPWHVTITQVDGTGKALADPAKVECQPSGCQQALQLFVDYKAQPFLAGVTFVDRGAYLALQPMVHELGQAVDFQKGFRGPVFVPVRLDENAKTDTLRFTLTGPAVPDASKGNAAIMNNSESLVFHRKLAPDLILRIELVRPSAAG